MKYVIGAKGAIAGLAACPHCGASTGYFRKTRVSGMTETNYSFNGAEADNTHLHETLNYVDQQTLYCQECRRRIGVAA